MFHDIARRFMLIKKKNSHNYRKELLLGGHTIKQLKREYSLYLKQIKELSIYNSPSYLLQIYTTIQKII